jgi:hypothetical protein
MCVCVEVRVCLYACISVLTLADCFTWTFEFEILGGEVSVAHSEVTLAA